MRQRLQQAVVVAKWRPSVLFARLAHHLNLHAAGPSGSFFVGARLYLADKWTESPKRMKETGVPDGVKFSTK